MFRKNLLFLLLAPFLVLTVSAQSVFPHIKFHLTFPTLEKIKEIIENKQKGMYLRFGDGDVNLAENRYDMMQVPRADLAAEMRQAFALNGPTILKTLIFYCRELGGLEEGMFPGNCETDLPWVTQLIHRAQRFWGEPISDVYSHAAIRFAAVQHPKECLEFLSFLKKQNCTVLVGNRLIPEKVRTALFGKNCAFVPTPERNSYSQMDRIERDCLAHIAKTKEYQVIIVSMGCSGRVFEKRIWQKADNIFLFDFGSLMDALCGWPTRDWIEATRNKKAIVDIVSTILNGGLDG